MSVAVFEPSFPRFDSAAPRSIRARERARLAHAMLANCCLCEHQCGVNRRAGQLGACRAGPQARIFSAQMEVSDEVELIPVFAIALSGCDLRCDFCITGKESWNSSAGRPVAPREIAGRARLALAQGARTIMILGGEPTIHLPTVLQIVAELPDSARLVWKTNAHGSAQARALLAGMFDVWVADYKFGNDDCALRLAKVSDYTRIVRENLLWANLNSELIIRHLLMPGHLDCCWAPVAEWIAADMPKVKVSLRTGFWPAWRASRHSELKGSTSDSEAKRAWNIARKYNLNLIV